MTMNITRHMSVLKRFCGLPKVLTEGRTISTGSSRVIKDLQAHCSNLGEALKEREALWLNEFNLGHQKVRSGRKTREIELNWTPHENPFQTTCKRRTKRQLIILGIAAVGALVAVGSTLFTQWQLTKLSAQMHANQEENIKVLQEHQVRTLGT